MHKKLILIITAAFVLAVALLAGVYGYSMLVQKNFGTVTPGEAYRAAQLDTFELARRTSEYGIRSIINLRGPSATGAWYRNEVAWSAAHGVAHYDLELMSTHQPSDSTMDSLAALFRLAPRPVLLHCMSGADRTSLAAALWQLSVDGRSPQAARRQLTLRHWHLPFGKTLAMDRAFERYVGRQGKR